MLSKFRFNVKICEKCKFFDGDVDESAKKMNMFYCGKFPDYITYEGSLQRYSPMKLTQEEREEIRAGYDRRVLLCPYYLEHTVSQEMP